jgi:PadR family transcriptional regulator
MTQKKQENMPRIRSHTIRSLSGTEYLIMSLILANRDAELGGLEITEMSNGAAKRGTIYVLLGRLKKKGYVTGRTKVAADVGPRTLYKATRLGKRVFESSDAVGQTAARRTDWLTNHPLLRVERPIGANGGHALHQIVLPTHKT